MGENKHVKKKLTHGNNLKIAQFHRKAMDLAILAPPSEKHTVL